MTAQQKYDFAAFKQSVNLSQYAAGHGYELDRKKSTRSSLVMRQASTGDKIIVSKKGTNWVYFSVSNDADNGTIVDFIAN
ncbi:MAG: topoisomerase, partial [Micavibrio aeruginosavorus]